MTTPVDEPAVAIPAALLLQVPPGVASFNVIVAPAHTIVEPEIADGVVLTVISCTAEQPSASV